MTTPTRPPGRGDLRTTLIEEGVRLGRVGGVAALGLREITRSVGVSANAAYRHFDDHDALLVAVAIEARTLLARHIVERIATDATHVAAAARPVQRVRSFGLGYINFALDEAGWLDLACYSQHAPSDAVPMQPGIDPPPPPHLLLVGALDDMAMAGALTDDQRVDAEWIVWSAVEGFTELATNGPLRHADRTRLDGLAQRVIDAAIRALTQSAGSGPPTSSNARRATK